MTSKSSKLARFIESLPAKTDVGETEAITINADISMIASGVNGGNCTNDIFQAVQQITK